MTRQKTINITNAERAAIVKKYINDRSLLATAIEAAETIQEIRQLDRRKKALEKRFRQSMELLKSKGAET